MFMLRGIEIHEREYAIKAEYAQDKYAENMLLAVIADAHRLSSLDNQSPVTRLGIASASHLSPWMAEAVAKWRSTVVEYTTASEMGHNEQIDEDELNRSEEHTSELQSLMRISYAVFCLKKKTTKDYITKEQ